MRQFDPSTDGLSVRLAPVGEAPAPAPVAPDPQPEPEPQPEPAGAPADNLEDTDHAG